MVPPRMANTLPISKTAQSVPMIREEEYKLHTALLRSLASLLLLLFGAEVVSARGWMRSCD
jgi:hypothetical protein